MWLTPSASSSKCKQSTGHNQDAATRRATWASSWCQTPSPLERLATASKLPSLPKNHLRIVVRPGVGLDVRICSQRKVFIALTKAARLPPLATKEDIVSSNLVPNVFVVSTPQEANTLACYTVSEVILTEQRHPVATYLTTLRHFCRGVIRGIDIDFTDADLQCMLRTSCNPAVLGARQIKNTTTVVILFNGLKVPMLTADQSCIAALSTNAR
ncbi:hypothetical protein HPB51_016275 [Rhipicephalus microplus]|uniref:Uncharacterized protein n=1 Tax=Rhipicephalus microplus TaxID=6941 RepID=A0A9J6EU58_RHIMP|nr:hypothetical protein HPB51_016275 [Rhipicephalus microplus]